MSEEALSQFVDSLLEKRGITTEEEKRIFLDPDYDRHVHDPFLLVDMERAVERILQAIDSHERIAIYADFDCDGIPAAVVLHDLFAKIGYENMEVYIPHRDREGYGLHTEAINKLAQKGVTLIVTVDLGITAVEAVAHAKALGVDVVVTDHHELPEGGVEALPAASAVVNPKRAAEVPGQEEYPFPDLCGAAVAHKLVSALIMSGRKKGLEAFCAIPDGWEKWLLDMVGIATIADMVPLVGENRVLARFGLLVLRKSPRLGLAALFRKIGIDQRGITEEDIGFTIAPRINAASRMDEPESAFRLLATRDIREAEAAAAHLESLNNKRKGAVASTVREVRRRVKERDITSPVVVLGDPKWRPSLLGLAANSLVSDCGGIVCLWGRDAAGNLKGSCRSDGSLSVVKLFRAAGEELEQAGGHHAAGGFAVSHEVVHRLQDIFNESAVHAEYNAVEEVIHDVDAELSLVNNALYQTLSALAPFGIGNPKPIFRFQNTVVQSIRYFGKSKDHMEIVLEGGQGKTMRAIQFFADPEKFSAFRSGARASVLAHVEHNTYRGASELRLRIVDISSA